MIFRVLAAANFMEISPLIDLTCLWCTFEISGKSPEEVIICDIVLLFLIVFYGVCIYIPCSRLFKISSSLCLTKKKN